MTPTKKIAILGSTGSIGTQALEVIAEQKEHFEVEVLTANSNADLLIEQALMFKPNCVVIGNESKYTQVKEALQDQPIKVYAGYDAIAQVTEFDSIDIVLTAMVGYAGLKPTIQAIKAGKTIALANKETLVVAGDLITSLTGQYNSAIIPVDSEHSAIFQCLVGEPLDKIEKIYLTASGGPFRGKTRSELAGVSKAQALKHPNWNMGAKITIDSATLMNKGLEVIEAKWLFGLKAEQIDVIVHPQSIIHSIVQFADGSMKAQMGLPDMKLPIQYAFTYPDRHASAFRRFDFTQYASLTFEKPDTETFRNLGLAYEAMKRGGNMPCILNAANEVAVDAFLNDRITFLQIGELCEKAMARVSYLAKPGYEDYVATDTETRNTVAELVS